MKLNDTELFIDIDFLQHKKVCKHLKSDIWASMILLFFLSGAKDSKKARENTRFPWQML